MRQLFAALIALALCVAPVSAQVGPLPGTGPLPLLPPAAVAAYSGPGDIVSGAVLFLSCQFAYNAAYATGSNKSCNLRRASDSHTCDVLIGTSGSWTNTASCSNSPENGTAVATWCNATTCSVTKAYDQTGHANDFVQATAAQQPTIVFSAVGGNAVMLFTSASNQFLTSALGTGIPFNTTFAAMLTNTTASQAAFFAVSGGSPQLGVGIVANNVFWYNGAVVESGSIVADNVYHNAVFVFVYNAPGSNATVDGVTTGSLATPSSSFPSFGTAGTTDVFGSDQLSGGHPFHGSIGEFAAWGNLTASAGQQTNLCHNIFIRWGTPNSC